MNRVLAQLKRLLPFAVIGGLVLWYGYVGQGHVAYTMDSLTYRDVVLNILDGHGLVSTNTFDVTPGFFPLLQWPPAYPVVWAALASTGIDIDVVPVLVALAGYIATLSLMYLIGKKLVGGVVPGIVSVLLYAAFPAGFPIFNFAWSETLFVPVMLIAFLSVLKASESAGKERVAWLGVAALCVGVNNWVRYTGVILLPLLGVSIPLMANGPSGREIKESALAVGASLLLTAPLWLRNYAISGMISGSGRGGLTRGDPAERLMGDLETLWNLVVYPLFGFDTVLYALLGLPTLGLIGYIAWTKRMSLRTPDRSTVLLLVWGSVILGFLLGARIVQSGVDFDYRMLAVPAPFAALWGAKSLVRKPNTASVILLVAMLAFSVVGSVRDAHHVHEQIVAQVDTKWRALAYGVVYRDLHRDFSYGSGLRAKLPSADKKYTVLTDYRGVFVRYLSGHEAYQVTSVETCLRLTETILDPLVFLVAHPSWGAAPGDAMTPASLCAAARRRDETNAEM